MGSWEKWLQFVADGKSEPCSATLIEQTLKPERPSSELFVVDTTDITQLSRRCPELFASRPDDAA